jgi:hypothetical protein
MIKLRIKAQPTSSILSFCLSVNIYSKSLLTFDQNHSKSRYFSSSCPWWYVRNFVECLVLSEICKYITTWLRICSGCVLWLVWAVYCYGTASQKAESSSHHLTGQVWQPRECSIDQISIKTPNLKCRLYWGLIEFIDWIYSQSCWYFWPLLCTSASTFSLVHLRPPPPSLRGNKYRGMYSYGV